MKKRTRTLLSASVLLMLSVATLVGATYALFTDTAKINNHLQAGNLNISLFRNSLTKNTLNSLGYLEESTDTTVVDFTGTTNKNIFGLENDEVIVPTSSFKADLELINGKKNSDNSITKSSVAFSYTVKIVVDSTTSNSDLVSQLNVTVIEPKTDGEGDDEVANGTLNNFTDFTLFTGVMNKEDESKKFSVKLDFNNLDPVENNKAQDKEAIFDLIVEAVQLTSEPTATSSTSTGE